jgi:TPP-dependent pyruvate/acetoin dehydrogenase alpha subunit
MRQDGWSDERLAEIDVRVARDLDEATRFARASAWPDPSTALDHMYAVEYPGLPATGVQ